MTHNQHAHTALLCKGLHVLQVSGDQLVTTVTQLTVVRFGRIPELFQVGGREEEG